MNLTAIGIDEVMDWVDEFCSTTGLLPTHALTIYAELCQLPSSSDLIIELAERESTIKRFDELKNPVLMHAYIHSFIAMQDEQLKERDEGAYDDRIKHYERVLEHRGFDDGFFAAFMESLSPTANGHPEAFEMNGRRRFMKRFVEDPFYPLAQMKTKIPTAFEAIAEIFHKMSSGMPVSPAGWLAVTKALGFVICKGSINNAWTYGEPSFQIDHDADPIPVFIIMEMNFPFVENPAVQQAEKRVGEYLSSRQIRRGILFVGMPVRMGEDEDSPCVVYWGKVYSDEQWLPLVLHQGSRSIEHIVADGTLVRNGLEGVDVQGLRDGEEVLVKIFADSHIDPTMELLNSDGASSSVH